MSLGIELSAPAPSTSTLTASTSASSLASQPGRLDLAELPRAPPAVPDPVVPWSALWVMPDGVPAIGCAPEVVAVRDVEVPLLSARVGDRWAKGETNEGDQAKGKGKGKEKEKEKGKGKEILKMRVEECRVVVGYGPRDVVGIQTEELAVSGGLLVGAQLSISPIDSTQEGSQAWLSLTADFDGVVEPLVMSIDTRHTSGYAMDEVEAVKARLKRWQIANQWSFSPVISELYATPIPPEGESLWPIPPKPDNYDPTDPATWTPKFRPISQAEIIAAWNEESKRLRTVEAATVAAEEVDDDNDNRLSLPPRKRKARATRGEKFKPPTTKIQWSDDAVPPVGADAIVSTGDVSVAAAAEAGLAVPVITAADYQLARPRRAAAIRSYKAGYSSEFLSHADWNERNDHLPPIHPKTSTSKSPAPGPVLAPARAARPQPKTPTSSLSPDAPSPSLSPKLGRTLPSKKRRKVSSDEADAASEGKLARAGSGAKTGPKPGRKSAKALVAEASEAEASEALAAELRDELGALEARIVEEQAEWRAVLMGELEARRALEEQVRRLQEGGGNAGPAELAGVEGKVKALEDGTQVDRARIAELERMVAGLEARLEAAETARVAAGQSRPSSEGETSELLSGLLADLHKCQRLYDACSDKDSPEARAYMAKRNAVAEQLNRLK